MATKRSAGVIDVEADLIAAGLKYGRTSTDVVAMANGTATLIHLHPDAAARRAALHAHLLACCMGRQVFAADELSEVGQAPLHGLAFAVSMQADAGLNDFGVAGRSLVAKPRWDKPDRLGCGQHGGLGVFEQSPVLLIDGPDFTAGGRAGRRCGSSTSRPPSCAIWVCRQTAWMAARWWWIRLRNARRQQPR